MVNESRRGTSERKRVYGKIEEVYGKIEQYPEKSNVSKQNLRDNAVRFKEVNIDQEANEGETNNVIERVGNVEWTNEMKINLLRIEDQERSKGR